MSAKVVKCMQSMVLSIYWFWLVFGCHAFARLWPGCRHVVTQELLGIEAFASLTRLETLYLECEGVSKQLSLGTKLKHLQLRGICYVDDGTQPDEVYLAWECSLGDISCHLQTKAFNGRKSAVEVKVGLMMGRQALKPTVTLRCCH